MRVALFCSDCVDYIIASLAILNCEGVLVPVRIDIQPGAGVGCINNDGHGVIPVAIFGSADLDVGWIDPATVTLESMDVRMVGKQVRPGLVVLEEHPATPPGASLRRH